MRRRALLGSIAGAGAVLLAGCGHPPPGTSLDLDEATDEAVANALVRALDQFDPEHRRIAARAIDEGSATAVEDYVPRLRDGTYLERDGTYYRVRTTLLERFTETGHSLAVVHVPSDRTVEGSPETVAFESLPAVDREAFRQANPEWLIEDGRGIGTEVFFQYGDRAADSRIVGSERLVVTYEGERFRVEYGGERTRERRRFRYETEAVATGRSAFAAGIRDRFRFDLPRGDLSKKQRSILKKARKDGGYREEDPISDAFADLIDRFRAHDPVTARYPTIYCVRYDGVDYFAYVDVIGPGEGGTETTRAPYRTPEGGMGGSTTGTRTTGTTETPPEPPATTRN